ncbi:MAG: M20/M25/M40 family metallo-hydrolase, partial [Paraburkholderia sp.]
EVEDDVKREIEQLLALAKERFGVRAEILEYRPTTGGATETAQDSKIVQASLAACRRHGNAEPGPFGFQGGCDLVHFRSVGAAGVVIGPGTLEVAHKPDEFVPIEEFLASSLIYRDIALDMLTPGGAQS